MSSNNRYFAVDWTPDGKLVYQNLLGTRQIWQANPDGSAAKHLTFEGNSYNPAVCPEGRFVVFSSARGGKTGIWRMERDRSNPTFLVEAGGEPFPRCSPDGRWVIYASMKSSGSTEPGPTLWKVPIDGGAPIKLNSALAHHPAISPNGSLIAAFYGSEHSSPQRPPSAIAVIPVEGGTPLKIMPLPTTAFWDAGLQWTPDGTAVTYVENRGGVSNIWGRPLDGEPARQLSNFTSEQISYFAWSRDGKLCVSRGRGLET